MKQGLFISWQGVCDALCFFALDFGTREFRIKFDVGSKKMLIFF